MSWVLVTLMLSSTSMGSSHSDVMLHLYRLQPRNLSPPWGYVLGFSQSSLESSSLSLIKLGFLQISETMSACLIASKEDVNVYVGGDAEEAAERRVTLESVSYRRRWYQV